MNIWLLNHFAIPPSKPGASRHYTFAHYLNEKGHNVHIFAGSHDHCSGAKLSGSSQVIHSTVEEGVPFVWVPTTGGKGYLARMLTMIKFYRNCVGSSGLARLPAPDLVFGSSPHLFAGLAAERLGQRYTAPFVLEIRDIWPESIIQLGKISRHHPIVYFFAHLEKRLYRSAQHIISPLSHANRHISRINPYAQVTVIPNGVDLSRVPDPLPPQPKSKFLVMYAGAHGLANGLDLVLDTAKAVQARVPDSNIQFSLIGEGPDKPRLMARCASEKISNVTFHDPLPKSRIYEELQKADVFFMPLKKASLFEHGISPNKLFDYMACARPVLFAVSATENPVKASGSGICVPPEDAEASMAALLRLKEMSIEERWALGQKGREYVLEHHDFRAQTDRLEAVFMNLVEQSGKFSKEVLAQ